MSSDYFFPELLAIRILSLTAKVRTKLTILRTQMTRRDLIIPHINAQLRPFRSSTDQQTRDDQARCQLYDLSTSNISYCIYISPRLELG
jgi:hypothetical protein